MRKIFVLGGDGFCGWPTALHLSALGHDVHILDSLVRRTIDDELAVQSLTPIATIEERLAAWHTTDAKPITFHQIDLADEYDAFRDLLSEHRPDAIVHLAEQRAAPYSMRSAFHKRYTVENNTRTTHNLLCALVDVNLDAHIVHLGTMGVYGYGTAGLSIPEGYLRATVDADQGPTDIEFLYPADPGSVYHMTKTLDALMFSYYNKNDRLRITDLHQGIVWGGSTPETSSDPILMNRFDYDGDYGTVLNRFLVQSAVGHPLTVHGTGQQTRAFIHIRDSVRCIQLAIENPPERGERVEIFNQATETHRLIDLANMVARLTGATIRFYKNPRNEAAVNELTVTNEKFLALGLEPTTLEAGLLQEVIEIITPHSERVNNDRIRATSLWTRDNELDETGSAASPDDSANSGS